MCVGEKERVCGREREGERERETTREGQSQSQSRWLAVPMSVSTNTHLVLDQHACTILFDELHLARGQWVVGGTR